MLKGSIFTRTGTTVLHLYKQDLVCFRELTDQGQRICPSFNGCKLVGSQGWLTFYFLAEKINLTYAQWQEDHSDPLTHFSPFFKPSLIKTFLLVSRFLFCANSSLSGYCARVVYFGTYR